MKKHIVEEVLPLDKGGGTLILRPVNFLLGSTSAEVSTLLGCCWLRRSGKQGLNKNLKT